MYGNLYRGTYFIIHTDPYPRFIDEVQPKPGESASLSEREDWDLGTWDPEATGSICVQILESRLLRPGDFIYFWENAELTVDGQQVTTAASHITEDEEVTLFDETNIVATTFVTEDEIDVEYEIIAKGVYSDTLCWTTNLQVGVHNAEILVWTSTGEQYTYNWLFEVIQ